jgi:7,8-dihydropterin-6-yl-methyl-4-(beta-D-ribofuranosyl)aminobenzene 5'-phosphate synthase
MTEIVILYDNVPARQGVKPAWGFSALITYQKKTILFDTGGKPDILLANMRAMKIAPASVSDVFISHNHWDHAGGLFSFLGKNHKVNVYLPSSFSETYQKEVKASGAKPVRIGGFTRLAGDIYSSGSLGEAIIEQALILDTPQGLIILTGCAHPGILKIVRSARKSLGKPVYAVLGGFHLASKSVTEAGAIISGFQKIGVTYVVPCHCTGEKAIRQFREAYGDKFIPAGAGGVIRF